MVRNLVDNAINYTPSSEERPGVITVRLLVDSYSQSLVVQVEDNGPGISTAEKERIFEPFYRAVDNTSDGGAGLGLSIARQVVTRHGGFISARNHLSGGLEVVIQLLDCEATGGSDADAPCQ